MSAPEAKLGMTAADYRALGGYVAENVPDYAVLAADGIERIDVSPEYDPARPKRIEFVASLRNPRWEWVDVEAAFTLP